MTKRLNGSMDDPAAEGMRAGREDNRKARSTAKPVWDEKRADYTTLVREVEVTVTLRTADGGWTTHTTTLMVLEDQDPVLLASSAASTAAKSAQMMPIQYLPKGVR